MTTKSCSAPTVPVVSRMPITPPVGALGFLEDFIREEVLPGTRTRTPRARHRAADNQTSRGRPPDHPDSAERPRCSGDLLRIRVDGGHQQACGHPQHSIPADLDLRFDLRSHIPEKERPVVFVGPFEHHSNELPGANPLATVVTIPEDADGHIDVDALRAALAQYAQRPLKIGSFSAASNVTGIMTDTGAISTVLHEHGALAFWDYAAAGPYVDIDMNPPDELAYADAVFLSPHKFIGGPGTPGLLVVRPRSSTTASRRWWAAELWYVNPQDHLYLSDIEHREEAGTPAIVESIRAGLVFHLKQSVGVDVIRAHEEDFLRRAIASWSEHPNIEILGNLHAHRLSIVSFVIRRPGGRYLHHNLVVAILNDLFGIQSRGGCSCAGPYGHRLLGIDVELSNEFQTEIARDAKASNPGGCGSTSTTSSPEAVFSYIVEAVELIADHGYRLIEDYHFEQDTGLWRHRRGPVEPPLRLSQLHYTDGALTYPHHDDTAGEQSLSGYLDQARTLLLERGDPSHRSPQTTPEFEHLRWFENCRPVACRPR